MPPETRKNSHDYAHRRRTVSSRVNVPLLLELRKREWSTWDEMLDCPVDWIEPISNGESKNGEGNGTADNNDSSDTNGTCDDEDELFQKETEVEECRTDETRIMTKLRRGVLDIGPTMSRLRSSTFSSCCLDRLVVIQCSCGEIVKREAYGTHHRVKHAARGSAPGSPTTSNGSVPSTPLTLQPPPPSKVGVHAKSTPPRLIHKRPSPNLVNNNNEEREKQKPRPPSRLDSQDWKILSSNEDGGTKLRIVRVNTTSQSTSSIVPKGGHENGKSAETVITTSTQLSLPPPPINTSTPSPPSSSLPSEERLISPRDRRAAHREEVRLARPPPPKRIRLTPSPNVPIVAREEETTTTASVRMAPPPTTVPLYRQAPSEQTPSSSHPSAPLVASTSCSPSVVHQPPSRVPSHSSQMGTVHQRISPHSQATITYTNEHGQKVYLMPRGATQMKPHGSLHPQQSMHGGMHGQSSQGYSGGGGGGSSSNHPPSHPPSGQRQTIVIVLPPGARRNGPIVIPPGATLRAIRSSSSSSIEGGMGGDHPCQPPVHYISHTPLPPTTRRLEMPSTPYSSHHRLVQQHNQSGSTVSHHHSSHHHAHLQQQSQQVVLQQQQQHHSVSSSMGQYQQYQTMNQGGEQYHGHHHVDHMGQRGQGYSGVPRILNQGMQRLLERRMVHTPSPPPILQAMPVLRAQLMEETARGRAKKSHSPAMVSSSTLDSPSHQPSSSTGSKEVGGMGQSALYQALHANHPQRGVVAREEIVSMEVEEDEDDAMPVLECHSTFNEDGEFEREEEEMPDTLDECDSSTTFSALPSSSTNM